MASKIVDMAREYYSNGAWTLDYLNVLAKAGKLTSEEYREITGIELSSSIQEEAYENTYENT